MEATAMGGIYRGYMGIMEKKMEATIVYEGLNTLGLGNANFGAPRGYSAIARCRDTLPLSFWSCALLGYSAVGHVRDTLRLDILPLGTARSARRAKSTS